MNIIGAIKERSVLFYVYLAVFAIANSAMAGALLFFINTKLIGEAIPYFDNYDFEIFIGIIIVSLLISYFFEIHMLNVTERIGIDLKKRVFNFLRFSDYENFLRLKEERVRTALYDISVLQELPLNYIAMLKSSILVIIGIGYLLWTDWISASILLSFIGVAVVYFIYSLKSINEDKNFVRNIADEFMRYVDDFLKGFRELKMDSKRSGNIFTDYIVVSLNDRMTAMLRFMGKFVKHRILSRYVVYAIIGFILFVLPQFAVFEVKTMTVFITTFLFIAGPISDLINRMDAITTIRISLNRISQVEQILNNSTPTNLLENSDKQAELELKEPFQNIEFNKVIFEYSNQNGGNGFRLGPVNFSLKKGEVVFLIGGNGSGKSTFVNLLSGLCSPMKGSIKYNGKEVQDFQRYRNQISCIFTDNYLFSENYDGFDFSNENQHFQNHLDEMRLKDVLKVDAENNTIGRGLSKGQQKRLALILTILEDRDLIIFDEWAAEQDPEFRKYFYRTILPTLKSSGKTVVAITHDDAYFDCADRVIKFEFGNIIKDSKTQNRTKKLIK